MSYSNTGSLIADPQQLQAIEEAIFHTVAYVDVFDYPLTANEVHQYLVGVAAPAGTIHALLENGRLVPHRLSRHQGYFTLPGRETIIETRQQRQQIAARLWPQAIRYGQMIAALPFVRMVAVTGSLAVDNALADADIDYLVVTEPGRLWLSRAMTILVVRQANRHGVTLCPNYFLSEKALTFDSHNLYTAHELIQMVPVSGLEVYHKIRQLNRWTEKFLPNAHSERQPMPPATLVGWQRISCNLLRRALHGPAGAWLEQWEMKRKIAKFTRQTINKQAIETAFSPDWCKGHFDGHGYRILHAYEERVQQDVLD